MRRQATGLKVTKASWHEVLNSVDKTSTIYFYQEDAQEKRGENLVLRQESF